MYSLASTILADRADFIIISIAVSKTIALARVGNLYTVQIPTGIGADTCPVSRLGEVALHFSHG
jgi:hypothetical protein